MPRASVVNKNVGTLVARAVGEDRCMDDAANKVIARALQLAATHKITGSYLSSFGVAVISGKNGVKDREVYNNDPAAHIIESGYLRKTKAGVKFIRGQLILTRAARSAGFV